MITLKDHLKYLVNVDYNLDFRDLYYYHNDTWITQNHDNYIPLTEMDTHHIRNAIAFIKREGLVCCFGLGPLWTPKLEKELEKRGN